MSYETKVRELYQAPLAEFVAERKRLARELRDAGEREAANRLTKAHRPTMSAWAVNQLYWHARDAFDAMLATAARLRKGDLDATAAHREALTKLRVRAAAILGKAGHTANEATLRRVTATLSAIAAAGGFDPDPPGALATDRDAPGFEAASATAHHHRRGDGHRSTDGMVAVHAQAHAHKERVAAAQAERRREEEHRAKIRQERHRLEAALRTARGDVHTHEREVASLQKQLASAEHSVERAKSAVQELEGEIAELDDGN